MGARGDFMQCNWEAFSWTRDPKAYDIRDTILRVQTKPHTDLWQRTYYHFRNDNAPVFQTQTDMERFSFVFRASFRYRKRFDQCGVVLYLDGENWLKGSIEYEISDYQHLGSVVTNRGYSHWATTEIGADVQSVWYRLSRREQDFRIEYSLDGIAFHQMRICHLDKAVGKISFGVYACSPEDSSFEATFGDMKLTECQWLDHDGPQPDADEC